MDAVGAGGGEAGTSYPLGRALAAAVKIALAGSAALAVGEGVRCVAWEEMGDKGRVAAVRCQGADGQ